MVDIGTAIANTIEFANKFLGAKRTIDIRLEEIESSVLNDTPVWLITLSNAFAVVDTGPLAYLRTHSASLGADATREYKVFTVAKDTGEVLSMKIRLLAVPAA
jgi:hypothetical protein